MISTILKVFGKRVKLYNIEKELLKLEFSHEERRQRLALEEGRYNLELEKLSIQYQGNCQKIEAETKQFILDAKIKGEQQNTEYECLWHNERQKRVVELAVLDGKIEGKKIELEGIEKLTEDRRKELDSLLDRMKTVLEAAAGRSAVEVVRT